MMKKNGFTLAEVLITLAIIGVVASLTLPSLMTNTAEQQAMTAYKKIINTLTEAGQMNAAIDGFDYSTATSVGSASDNFEQDDVTSIGSIINSRLQILQKDVTIGSQDANDRASNCAILGDGTAICLSGSTFGASNGTVFLVDTNGKKGPNKIATCDGGQCNTAKNRHIYDQFYVTLRGGVAYPGTYTLTNSDFKMNTTAADNAVRYVVSGRSGKAGS